MGIIDEMKKVVEEAEGKLTEVDKALKVMETAREDVHAERRDYNELKDKIGRIKKGLAEVK